MVMLTLNNGSDVMFVTLYVRARKNAAPGGLAKITT